MNVVFAILFILSNLLLLIFQPENFLSALLDGSSKAAALCLSLVATYAVWLGLMQLWQDSGLSKKISSLLRPIAKKIFKTDDKETLENVCMNLSVNLLGISGAATPYGIKAAALLNRSENSDYVGAMFFALNATSLQLIPTSVIGIRVALGSVAPTNIVLPTVFTTLFSTLLAVLLVRILIPPKQSYAPVSTWGFRKRKGASI